MSDPVDERLRSYYQSIQSDAPGRLEARVARALDSAPAPLAARAAWRPAFGLAAVGAAVVIVALVVRGIGPGPTASPSGVIGPSASPIPTASATPTQGPSVTTTPTAPTPTPVRDDYACANRTSTHRRHVARVDSGHGHSARRRSRPIRRRHVQGHGSPRLPDRKSPPGALCRGLRPRDGPVHPDRLDGRAACRTSRPRGYVTAACSWSAAPTR
jgi:hypothetical protein